MSHYTGMIVLPAAPTKDTLESTLTDLLAPYSEEIEVEEYKDYIEQGDRWPRDFAAKEAGIDPTDDQSVAQFMAERYPTDKYGADEKGLYRWSTYNPKSKWDWWAIGGRWKGYFQVRSGATSFLGHSGAFGNEAAGPHPADVVRKGDIDIDAMIAAAAKARGEGWDKAQEMESEMRAFIYEIGANDTRETYIARGSTIERVLQPYAVLADGEWREPGQMGWFGADDSTDDSQQDYSEWFAEFWSNLSDDTWLAVVDLHI